MKRVFIFFSFLFVLLLSPILLFSQNLIPFLIVFDWIKCDSISARAINAEKISGSIAGGFTVDELILSNFSQEASIAINASDQLLFSGASTYMLDNDLFSSVSSSYNFYGYNTSIDATLRLERYDGADAIFGASTTYSYIGTRSEHALIIKTNNVNRIGLNGNGTGFYPLTTGTLYLGTESSGFRGLYIEGKKSSSNLVEIVNDNDGEINDSSFTIDSRGMVTNNGLTTFNMLVNLGDTEEYSFVPSVAGWGFISADAGISWAQISFTDVAVVTLIANNNATTTNNNDNTLNIYDGGSYIVIENQLGDVVNVAISINYYTP